MLRAILAEAGIECLIRNESLAVAMGEIPVSECFPELWILNDSDYSRAAAIIAEWRSSATRRRPTPWVCPSCGERSRASLGRAGSAEARHLIKRTRWQHESGPMAFRVPRVRFSLGLTSVMGAWCLCFAAEPGAPGPARVAIVDGRWQIGGEVTHRGSRAEGLLMNVRMVNGTFEDTNDATRPKGFDVEANTAAFIEQIPE